MRISDHVSMQRTTETETTIEASGGAFAESLACTLQETRPEPSRTKAPHLGILTLDQGDDISLTEDGDLAETEGLGLEPGDLGESQSFETGDAAIARRVHGESNTPKQLRLAHNINGPSAYLLAGPRSQLQPEASLQETSAQMNTMVTQGALEGGFSTAGSSTSKNETAQGANDHDVLNAIESASSEGESFRISPHTMNSESHQGFSSIDANGHLGPSVLHASHGSTAQTSAQLGTSSASSFSTMSPQTTAANATGIPSELMPGFDRGTSVTPPSLEGSMDRAHTDAASNPLSQSPQKTESLAYLDALQERIGANAVPSTTSDTQAATIKRSLANNANLLQVNTLTQIEPGSAQKTNASTSQGTTQGDTIELTGISGEHQHEGSAGNDGDHNHSKERGSGSHSFGKTLEASATRHDKNTFTLTGSGASSSAMNTMPATSLEAGLHTAKINQWLMPPGQQVLRQGQSHHAQRHDKGHPPMRWALLKTDAGDKARVHMQHPTLGALSLEMTMDEGKMDISFLTSGFAAAMAIRKDRQEIRALLKEHGTQLSTFHVQVEGEPEESPYGHSTTDPSVSKPRQSRHTSRYLSEA